MKLKSLLSPAIILLAIYWFIWVIIPIYTNPDGVGAMRDSLNTAKKNLDNINQKKENSANLLNELNYNPEQQSVVFQYLPDTKKDEDIIETLNTLSAANSLLMSDTAIEDIKNDTGNTAITAGNVYADVARGNNGIVDNNKTATDIVLTESIARKFVVKVEVIGRYEKIRQFIASLATLKRHNKVVAVSIAKKIAVNEEVDSDAESSRATVSIEFDYLPKITSIANVDNEIFLSEKFDMSIIGDITNKTSTDISKINIGSAGRVNPFSL